MHRYLRILLFFCLFLNGGIAFTILAQSIKIQGVPTEILEPIRQREPSLFFPSPSLTQVDQLVREIMETNHFDQVTAFRHSNGIITIEAEATKILANIKFRGNRLFSSNTLKEIMEIKESQPFEKKHLMESEKKIEEYYKDQGYYNTHVEIQSETAGIREQNVLVTIEERKPCLIDQIEFDTPNPKLQHKLLLKTRGFLHTPLSATSTEKIKSNIESYLLAEQFFSTFLSPPELTYNKDRTTAQLKYSLQDSFQYERIINGYKDLDIFDIQRAINPIDGVMTSGDPIVEAAERIKKKYLEKGYAHIQLNVQSKENQKQFLRKGYISINEGPKVKMSEIQVNGQISRTPDYYANIIRHNSSELIQQGYFNRAALELGQENLINELHNQGFLRAKVQSWRNEYNAKKSEVKIKIIIDEGPLTQVQAVEFKGIKAFSDSQLREVVSVRHHSPLRLASIEESIIRLKNFYRQNGYLEMKIKNINDQLVEYNNKGTEANVKFEIDEGPKVIVSSINIEGNRLTKDYVILREIDFSIGDTLTPEKIDESQMRLNRTGLFNQVNIRTLEDGTPISQRTVLISVQERDPGLFKLGIGADSERKLTLRQFTSLSYNNIAGTARGTSGRIEFGYNPDQVQYLTYRASLGYLEPFLLGSRTRGRIHFTRQREISRFDDLTRLTEITDSSRVDFLLERDLSRHLKVTWTLWSLDSIRAFERNGNCLDGRAEKCPDQVDRIALIGPAIDNDLRDNPFLPTRGSHRQWSLYYSDPDLGSSMDVNFVKTEMSYSYLWNLGSPFFVWANQAKAGYLSNLSEIAESKIPSSQIFFLGGTSSIRGFGGGSSNERIPQTADFSDNEVSVKKDSHYYLLRSELRFPTMYESLGGVIFYDGGLVQVTGHHFLKPYRHGAGLGLRFNTPVGPVSLDLGFKLNPIKKRNEDLWRLHFFIGTF